MCISIYIIIHSDSSDCWESGLVPYGSGFRLSIWSLHNDFELCSTDCLALVYFITFKYSKLDDVFLINVIPNCNNELLAQFWRYAYSYTVLNILHCRIPDWDIDHCYRYNGR